MPFDNRITNAEPDPNVDAKEEHRQIIDQISVRRAEHERLENKSAELARVEEALEHAKTAYSSVQKQAEGMSVSVGTLQKGHQDLTTAIHTATTKLNQVIVDADTETKKLSALQFEAIRTDGRLERAKNELIDVEKQKETRKLEISDTENTLKTIKASIVQAENDLKTTKEAAVLEIQQVQAETVLKNKEYAKAEEVLRALQEEISIAKLELAKTQENNAKIIEAAEILAKNIVEEAEKKAVAREKILDDREGLANKRDVWQAELQQRLRAFKMELEKLTNRKLPIQIEI